MDEVSQSKAMIEKPPTAQRKKRIFTEEEEKDVSNVDVVQTKVSIHITHSTKINLVKTKFKLRTLLTRSVSGQTSLYLCAALSL